MTLKLAVTRGRSLRRNDDEVMPGPDRRTLIGEADDFSELTFHPVTFHSISYRSIDRVCHEHPIVVGRRLRSDSQRTAAAEPPVTAKSLELATMGDRVDQALSL